MNVEWRQAAADPRGGEIKKNALIRTPNPNRSTSIGAGGGKLSYTPCKKGGEIFQGENMFNVNDWIPSHRVDGKVARQNVCVKLTAFALNGF